MEPLLVIAKGLSGALAGPLFLLWIVVGWAAPFMLLSAVLSLRRIARALERHADALEPRRAGAGETSILA
jgi:hypothetical protein